MRIRRVTFLSKSGWCDSRRSCLLYTSTTAQIDKIIYNYIVQQGAKPNFKGYGGFPGSACISVNDTVIHGIPSKHIVLKEGDIVSIDTGAAVHGWNGDNAATFACGSVSDRAQRIMDVTKEALARGIAAAQPGNRVGDIGAAVSYTHLS